MKWSILRYGFEEPFEEDHDAEEEAQGGRDRCETTQVDVLTAQGTSVADAIRQIGVTEVTFYLYGRLSRCKI